MNRFKYEQLPIFCFYYGLIGHQERACDRKMSNSRENKVCEGQLVDGWGHHCQEGKKMGSVESALMKQLELRGN